MQRQPLIGINYLRRQPLMRNYMDRLDDNYMFKLILDVNRLYLLNINYH